MWGYLFVHLQSPPNTVLAAILIWEEGIYLKLFVKVVNEQFQALNLRLDSLQFQEKEEEEYSDVRSHGRR